MSQTLKKRQNRDQHIINIVADSNKQLIATSPTATPISSPVLVLSPPNLNWLDDNTNNAASFETPIKQLPDEDFSANELDKKRRLVIEAAVHSWSGYEEHAWGLDELQPLTQDGKETLGGLGATIVDSLDTLWLMGLKEEFGRSALLALDWTQLHWQRHGELQADWLKLGVLWVCLMLPASAIMPTNMRSI